MKIAKVLAAYGDAVTIQLSTNVWVDHCDLSGDETVGKDTYDGLVDLSHAADFVTISHTYFHNHVSLSTCAFERGSRKLTKSISTKDPSLATPTATLQKTLVTCV